MLQKAAFIWTTIGTVLLGVSCVESPSTVAVCLNCDEISQRLFKENKFDSLLLIADSMLKIDSTNIRGYEAKGMALSHLNNDSLAIKYLSKAVMLGSNQVEVFFWLAYSEANVGDTIAALFEYDNVLTRQPDHYKALNNRGAIYRAQFRSAESKVDLKRAIALFPDRAVAYSNLGLLYSQEEKLDSAIYFFSLGLECEELWVLRFNRAIAYYRADKLDSAINDFSKSIDLDPNYADAYRIRAYCYSALGKTDSACVDIKLSAELGNQIALWELSDFKCD